MWIDGISIRETLVQIPQDTDGDSTPDYLDLDSDNDGCFDAFEGAGGFSFSDINGAGSLIAPIDSNGVPGGTLQATTAIVTDNTSISPVCDSDGDGVVYTKDLDNDNDGITDATEGIVDTDGDGVINNLDLDSDNDGIKDVVETGDLDTDGDGIIDGFIDLDGNGLHDPIDNPELHPQDNAASIITEVNGIGSVIDNVVTLTPDASISVYGTYSLKSVANTTGTNNYVRIDFPVIVGQQYNVKFWVQTGVGTQQRIFAEPSIFPDFYSSYLNDPTGAFYDCTITANSTGTGSIYFSHYGGNPGDEMWI